jgi:hypothetical protein
MDLKALMQKLEIIDKKQNLMEAEKKETTWTDKSGKKHPATQVKGDKYTGKEAEKDAKKKEVDENRFTSGIAQALLREFGIEEKVTLGTGAPVYNPATGVTAGANQGKTPNPWANDPAKSAAWSALTPEDQKWLGGADPTDPMILRRAPNKGAKTNTAADVADADLGAAMTANANAAKVQAAKEKEIGANQDAEMANLGAAMTANAQAAKEKEIGANQDADDQATGQAMTANAAAASKGSKPVGPTATTQEKMDRFVYLMKLKSAPAAPAAAPAPAAPVPTLEGQMYNLLSTLAQLSESVVLEALTPEEEKELQTIAPEVVGTVDGGAEGIPPEVAKAVAAYKSSGQAAQPSAPKAAYKGSTGAQEIQKLNPAVKDVNKISVGQKLKMPDGSEYTVKPGDTLDKIAKGVKAAPFRKELSQADMDAISGKTQKPGGQAAQPASGAGPTKAAAAGQDPSNPLNQKPGQAAQPAAGAVVPAAGNKPDGVVGQRPAMANDPRLAGAPAAATAPTPSGQAAQPAGKVDLSVNNPAMNPANNAPLPVPGTATPGQLSPQQTLARQDIARAQAKAAQVAPSGTGSGTLQGGQAAQPAATDNQKKLDAMKAKYGTPGSTTRESVQSEDDLILARIKGVSIR